MYFMYLCIIYQINMSIFNSLEKYRNIYLLSMIFELHCLLEDPPNLFAFAGP